MFRDANPTWERQLLRIVTGFHIRLVVRADSDIPDTSLARLMTDITKAKVFTTGQVAEICQVAPRTVSKWFDTGRLRGYRIPGSQDRRIPRESLIAFMKEHGVPLGELRDDTPSVLVVGVDREVQQSLTHLLASLELELRFAQSTFDAGVMASSLPPQCVVIDTSLGVHDAATIACTLRQPGERPSPSVICLVSEADRKSGLDESLFTETFRKPFDVVLLAERVRTLARTRAAA